MDQVLAGGPVDEDLGLLQGRSRLVLGGRLAYLLDGRAKRAPVHLVLLGTGFGLTLALLGGLDLRPGTLVLTGQKTMPPGIRASMKR